MVLTVKFVPARPLNWTVLVTGDPSACAAIFTVLGVAIKPGVAPGVSTVIGITSELLLALFAVRTRLPLLNPGPRELELIEIPIAVGVVVELAEYVINDAAEVITNVK